MKRLFSLIILLLFSIQTFAQNKNTETEKPQTGILDVCGLYVTFKQEIYQGKCTCESGFLKKYSPCKMFELKVDSVLFMRDSSVYRSEAELKKVKYVVLGNNFDNITTGIPYTLFIHYSPSKKYFVLSKIFEGRFSEFTVNLQMAHVTNLIECKKYSFFQKIFLSLGISKKKIWEKAKPRLETKNKFLQAIKEYEANPEVPAGPGCFVPCWFGFPNPNHTL
ncbi:MAG: hypothetical protein WA004_19455 [Saprospiraceae bacterium]